LKNKDEDYMKDAVEVEEVEAVEGMEFRL